MFEKLDLKLKKKNFDKSKDISKFQNNEFNLPLVNAKNGNNGIMYYGREVDFEDDEMTIDIVNDGAISTGNVYAQPQKTGVLYNAYLIKLRYKNISKKLLLYLSCSIQKSIKLKFSYENKAGWTKVKEEKISLPIKDGKPDFAFMEVFITAIQKLAIKDVVLYTQRELEATEKAINMS